MNHPDKRLLIATGNKGKFAEIKHLLSGVSADLLNPEMINASIEVRETGNTYLENALLKGKAYARSSGLLTLADDSGLEVAALNGAPGIRSARFSPRPGASDADRRAYLLHRLQGFQRPWTAIFRCLVVLVTPQEIADSFEGVCRGEIIPNERGVGGFGYDPIFLIPDLGLTMAELSMEQKNRISHRARAVRSAMPAIIKLLDPGMSNTNPHA
jgi:XTP/dITP diphosphohydrolase